MVGRIIIIMSVIRILLMGVFINDTVNKRENFRYMFFKLIRNGNYNIKYNLK